MNCAFAQEVDKLITYVLTHTSMHILMIPHVTWKTVSENQDDRELSRVFCSKYNSNRITMLDIDGLNYCQIRYVISKCRFFIGARTHSSIAAYSSYVPTLVVGYSVKARGIARDLFGDEEKYVLPVQTITRKDDLLEKFGWILQNEDLIRKQLIRQIPKFIKRSLAAKDYVERLLLEGDYVCPD